MPAHIGAESLKKPHHIVTLWFSEIVKDHAICSLSCDLFPNINFSRCVCTQRMAHFSGLKIGASPMMVGKLVVTFSLLPVPWWPSVSQSFCYSSLGVHWPCKFAHVARESCAAQNSGWAWSLCSWFSSMRLQGKLIILAVCLPINKICQITMFSVILPTFQETFEVIFGHLLVRSWRVNKQEILCMSDLVYVGTGNTMQLLKNFPPKLIYRKCFVYFSWLHLSCSTYITSSRSTREP